MKPKEIIQLVSQSVGIPIDEILSRSRKRELVDARKLTAHFLRKHAKATFQSIADEMEITHANAMHYIRILPSNLMYDKQLQRIYNTIERQILIEDYKEPKYKLDVPFLTHDIFIHLVKKTIEPGNDKQTIENFSKLYINNFIN